MELFLKCAGGVLVAVVLILTLGRKDLGLLLSMAVCAMTAMAAAELLEPVTALVDTLESLGGLDGGSVAILFKAVGVGLITDIAAMVCTDSGNASMAKAVGLLGTAAVLWLSIPLFHGLLSLIQEILEGL